RSVRQSRGELGTHRRAPGSPGAGHRRELTPAGRTLGERTGPAALPQRYGRVRGAIADLNLSTSGAPAVTARAPAAALLERVREPAQESARHPPHRSPGDRRTDTAARGTAAPAFRRGRPAGPRRAPRPGSRPRASGRLVQSWLCPSPRGC